MHIEHIYFLYIFQFVLYWLIMQSLRTTFPLATKKKSTEIYFILFFLLWKRARSPRSSCRRLMKSPQSDSGPKSFAICWRHQNLTARERERKREKDRERTRRKESKSARERTVSSIRLCEANSKSCAENNMNLREKHIYILYGKICIITVYRLCQMPQMTFKLGRFCGLLQNRVQLGQCWNPRSAWMRFAQAAASIRFSLSNSEREIQIKILS